MRLLELLEIAAKAYPDEALRDHYNHRTGAKVWTATGDGLARFIVIELIETYEPDRSDQEQLECAVGVMRTAHRELEGVLHALCHAAGVLPEPRDVVRYTEADVDYAWDSEVKYHNTHELAEDAKPLRTWWELEPDERQELMDEIADAVTGSDIIPEAMHEGIRQVAAEWVRAQAPQQPPEAPCQHESRFRSLSCGVGVCDDCGHHQGLARCFCGWSASGGDGRAELVAMGETIEEED